MKACIHSLHTYIRTYNRRTYIHACMHTYIHTHIHTIHAYIYIYIYTYIHEYMHTNVRTYIVIIKLEIYTAPTKAKLQKPTYSRAIEHTFAPNYMHRPTQTLLMGTFKCTSTAENSASHPQT